MEDFKKQGGALGGQQEKTTFFSEGQPRSLHGQKVSEYGREQGSTLGSNGINGSNDDAKSGLVSNGSRTTTTNGSTAHNGISDSSLGKQNGTNGSTAR